MSEDGVSAPLRLFDTLEGLRYPTHVTVDRAAGVAAMCVPVGGAPGAAIHLVDVETGRARIVAPEEHYTYDLTRYDGAGELVAACGLVDGELETVVAFDPLTGDRRCEIALDGALEDLVHLRQRLWVARVADPGSERDGMHLGTRVSSIGDVFVLPPQRRWRRLVVVDLDAGTATPLATPGWTIWEHDASAGTVLAVASTDPSPAGYYEPALISIDVDTAAVDVIHRTTRQLARPRLHPGGITASVIEGRSIVSGRVRRFDLETGASRLVDELDDVTDIVVDGDRTWYSGWSDRGSFIAVTAPTPEATSADGPEATSSVAFDATLHGRDAQPSVVPLGEDRCLVVIDDVASPAELAVVDVTSATVRRLTDFNGAVAGLIERPRERALSWRASDGTEIRGALIEPATARRPVPLVVMVHGGPTWLWSTMYSPAESNQLALPLVAAGAAVLLPNPRGSSGRGVDFADAVAGNVGSLDADDIVTGIDHLVAEGVVDPSRVAVIGTSYGGYMAGWLGATTSRFRCAVAMACVADWCSFALTSAIGGGFDRVYFPGADIAGAAGREQLAASSTVFHASAATTPLLVIHGDQDRVTPIGQADALVHAWHRAGAPVEQVVYPDEGHEFADPRRRRDAARRVLSFMQQYGIVA